MIGTGLAILGAGLLGAGASIYGANKASSTQADAANQAAQIQAQGQQRALDFQSGVFGKQSENFDASKANVSAANDFLKDNVGYLKGNFDNSSNLLKANYDKTAGDLNPFIKSGIGANNLLANFYGVDGGNGINSSALAQFMKSPDYLFALKGGSDALDNSLAAKGGALGGNAIRAQTEYGSGLATQNLTNYLTRLTGMAGTGAGAATTLGSLGAQTGSTIGSLGAQTGATIAGTGTAMLGGATNMASVGANLGSGLANTNAYTNLNGSNNIAQSVMGAGTATAAGINGMVKGFDSGLSALSLYNQLGKSSYGTPTNLLSSYTGTGSAYNGNQIGQLY